MLWYYMDMFNVGTIPIIDADIYLQQKQQSIYIDDKSVHVSNVHLNV